VAKGYQRDPDGLRLAFHGMNTVLPPDRVPAGKYPFAQNVRAYLHDRTTGRATQAAPQETLATGPVHSLRRLNDSTPAGPGFGFILVGAASEYLYAGTTEVARGLTGNPVSLVPFRPNASVQPWMYVGDSAENVTLPNLNNFGCTGMLKVRSDGTCYKMGIMEPQIAPSVTFVPASDTVSLLGPVTVYYYNNPSQSHNPPLEGVYIWKNAADPVGGSSVVQTTGEANGVATGSSLLFDYGLDVGGQNPVAWTQFQTYTGTVSTSGTAVTWLSGNQFGGLAAGDAIVISGVTYTITGTVTNTTLNLTVTAGSQTAVNYSAAAISGTVPLFVPAMESAGYQDFNCSILATLYIPAAGSYTFSAVFKDDMIWGIGNGPGTATWAAPSGGENLSTIGQTITTINGYPLMPRIPETSGEDGHTGTASVAVSFSAAGNYPIEIDWDYWYHMPRGLSIMCDGVNIPPIAQTVITASQYRYTYRSSATGATSNPSPESPEAALSVVSNNVTAFLSSDPQVDKIDFYRLDSGLENFTYVGTVSNTASGASISTTTTQAVVDIDVPYSVNVVSTSGFVVGQTATIDSGANLESITITALFPGRRIGVDTLPPSITATFTKTHVSGVTVKSTSPPALNDTLLDTDIAANPILDFDNYEPFPSIDLPRSGVVTVTGGVVSWVSGDLFNVRWLPGTIILIGTVAYTLNTRPTSSTSLTASNVISVAGVQTVILPPDGANQIYEIAEPDLAAQPLAYLWGPTDNVAYFFAVGDPLRPGTLYWSKGNNPDSAPDTNQQDVTSPSEPLQNGCLVNGYGWVASTERAWLIIPNFFNALATAQGVEGSTWTLQESSLKRGLFIPRCLTVDGGGNVYFRAKDGIYVSPGGQGGKSITDQDLFNLFPHEGFTPSPVTVGGFTVYPPDDSLPYNQSLNVANGYLYYDYLDASNTLRTLVYDIAAGGWVVDSYADPVSLHILEEGVVNGTLVGCATGNVRSLTATGTEVATSVLLVPSFNAGDTRASKFWGDLYIEAEEG
jgi:hypothetical protein